MTDQKPKYREFWIDIDHTICPIPHDPSVIHVIEANYAKELELKLNIAVEALKMAAGYMNVNHDCPELGLYPTEQCQICYENSFVDKALEQINKPFKR